MTESHSNTWARFLNDFREYPSLGMSLDTSRVDWPERFLETMKPKIAAAFDSMAQLEQGAIANPDENRMVGHYWLRAPELAPDADIKIAIESTLDRIKSFANSIHSGEICGEKGQFKNVIVIGIGGSALGPLFVSTALGSPASDKLNFHIFDNTDPDGIDRVLEHLDDQLGQTLCVVVSKSGGTKETRNGMLEAKMAYEKAGLRFQKHAVAVTQHGSQLDKVASDGQWIERFPMWDWVGGRTSELSAVGLLPAALQGIDIDLLIKGAADMDQVTREQDAQNNPAMRMALAWYASGNGKGDKNLVVLPYKDRLELFSKYLQQLIMESLGKERNQAGDIVHQGLSVFGNKGSTDQHSFVQQLRDGRKDFIVTFVEVLKDRQGESAAVEGELTTGDFLQGFLLGTRQALSESGRESITLTVGDVNAYSVGSLIALFERTVGLYASLIGINAYHQPGVEAGKKAAASILQLKQQICACLTAAGRRPMTSQQIAEQIDTSADIELIYKICKRLAANTTTGLQELAADRPDEVRFQM